MEIRTARPEDAEAVGEIRVRAWRAGYRAHLPAEFLASLDPTSLIGTLRSNLFSPTPPFLMRVVDLKDSLAAFSILGKPRYEAADDTAELWALNVDPAYWRQGFGRHLVRRAVDDAKAWQLRRVELWCLAGNFAAMQLYETCGFTLIGTQRTTTKLTGLPLHEVAYAMSF